MIGARELALLPPDAVVVNTSRGPVLDLDALEAALRSGHVAGAGLDVIPVEPPVEPEPKLLRAYRAREPWLEGRLVGDAACRVPLAAGLGRHPPQIRRDDGGGAAQQPAAERDRAGRSVIAARFMAPPPVVRSVRQRGGGVR